MAKKYYSEDDPAGFAVVYADTAPVGFTEITDAAELLDLHKKRYNKLSDDGADYYNGFRSQIYLDILNGDITDVEAFLLEAHVKELADNLNTGNWLTAQNTNTNLSLSGIYDQVMKDKLQADIDAYVTENY